VTRQATDAFERRFESPADALAKLLDRLGPVGSERSEADVTGRVLAEPLLADRDSPACDVSAMDGYAVRVAELSDRWLPVAGEASIGRAAPPLPPGAAMRIFTGSPIPEGADAVVRREDVREQPDRIDLRPDAAVAPGASIRRRGENIVVGETVVQAGVLVTPAVAAALSAFGVSAPAVFRKVRVSIMTTGDELLSPGAPASAWQLRDSNGPALMNAFARCAWLEVVAFSTAPDDPAAIQESLESALQESDAVVMTGGVSMGQYDYLPQVIPSVGAHTVFHQLSIRPGKPTLAAVTPEQQLIVGLPGNPVAVLVTARRLAIPALARMAGVVKPVPRPPVVTLEGENIDTLHLYWFRPVELCGPGRARLVSCRGSGDLVAAARSDGFVEVPPAVSGTGPFPFFAW